MTAAVTTVFLLLLIAGVAALIFWKMHRFLFRRPFN
jgi:hypothetical protein